MPTCHCQATEGHFSNAVARRDLQRYHSRGPDRTTSAYSNVVAQEAGSRGVGDRLRLVQADAVDADARLPDAELVALDRVVCCYPDWAALLHVAAKHCRRHLALSYPRDRWYVRLFVRLDNGRRRLTGKAFRPICRMS
jgi:magnesium-protoporphyrin O-methyltransferase